MNNKKYIFFDLDGTLTEPSEGIVNSVLYALSTIGIVENDTEKLKGFIGPPLTDSFKEYYGFELEKSLALIKPFREYFEEKGIYQNKLYDKTVFALSALKGAGKKIALATSKPEPFAIRILEYFSLTRYFDVICGSKMSEKNINKTDVLKDALSRFPEARLDECVMVGDRRHDVEGAANVGIDCIGILHGFGSTEELSEAGAALIVKDFDGLIEALI